MSEDIPDVAKLNALGAGEAMFTQRSIRRLRPDPIPMDDLRLVIEAAVHAPNGGNSQPTRLVLVTDRRKLDALGTLYREAWWAKRRDSTGWKTIDDIPAGEKVAHAAARFADDIRTVPAMVLAFGDGRMPAALDALSVVPAVQNLMLAARALGIGSLPTTLHPDVMERLFELLKVPARAQFHLLVPLGYPVSDTAFGLTRRKPTNETTYLDEWGGAVPW